MRDLSLPRYKPCPELLEIAQFFIVELDEPIKTIASSLVSKILELIIVVKVDPPKNIASLEILNILQFSIVMLKEI